MQLRYNVSQIEEFLSRRNMREGPIIKELNPLVQSSQLMQVKKQDENVSRIMQSFYGHVFRHMKNLPFFCCLAAAKFADFCFPALLSGLRVATGTRIFLFLGLDNV